MSDLAHAYYKWLGIPPEEHPPHHYRLLGITPFERDADVISAAADRQMIHVRTYASGPQGSVSQSLLNEISAARLTLLDPAKKSAYDAQLRAKLASSPPVLTAAKPAPPRAAGPPALATNAPATNAPATRKNTVPKNPQPARSPVLLIAGASGAVLLVLILGFLYVFSGSGTSGSLPPTPIAAVPPSGAVSAATTNEPPRTIPATPDPAMPVPVPSPEPVVAPTPANPTTPEKPLPETTTPAPLPLSTNPPPDPQPTKDPASLPPKTNPLLPPEKTPGPMPVVGTTPAPQPGPMPAIPAVTNPLPVTNPPPVTNPLPPANDPAKSAEDLTKKLAELFDPNARAEAPADQTPDAAALAEARKLVRSVFGKDLDQAKKAKKSDPAQELLKRAQAADVPPAEAYAMAEEACEVGTTLGDVQLALSSATFLQEKFPSGKGDMVLTTLQGLLKTTKSPSGAKQIAGLAIQAVNQAVARGDYDSSTPYFTVAQAALTKAKEAGLQKQLASLRKTLQEEKEAYEKAVAGFAKMKADPANSEARLAVARYVLASRVDWRLGIPLLLESPDAELQGLARKEAQAPSLPEAQVELADGWWTRADHESGDLQKALRARAGFWYEQSLPRLTGLAQARVQKRVDELAPIRAWLAERGAMTTFAQEVGQAAVIGQPPPRNQGVLLVMSEKTEAKTAMEACVKYGLAFRHMDNFDRKMLDYLPYHTVFAGRNCMDYWGDKNSPERRAPEAFAPLAQFVARGGHLILGGTFDGNNGEHLAKFGITTGRGGGEHFVPIPGITEHVFKGCEGLVPPERTLRLMGHAQCSRPFVPLLMCEGQPGVASLLTTRFEQGRVTITGCEPYYRQDHWLITVLLSWAARGCPLPENAESIPIP